VRAVLFDLDDTLCNTGEADAACLRAAFARLQQKYPDLDPPRVRDVHRATREAYALEVREGNADFSHAKVARRMLETLGIHDEGIADEMVATFLQVQREMLRPSAGAVDALTLLKRGASLGVVTNGPTVTQRHKLDLLGLTPLFDCVTISAEVGVWKPDPGIFRMTLEALGAAPEDAAMVGDIPALDLAPAKALGMTTVRFIGHAQIADSAGVADLTCERFSDLPSLLRLGV
jgi:HAD superfamily hydrolase (TIGR01549 family)